jgi:hypothetical protein
MLIDKGALERVPAFAVVPEPVVIGVLRELSAEDMRPRLDRVFRRLENEQPALAGFLASELSALETGAGQALGYFLFLAVCSAFREAFGARIGPLTDADLDAALDTLLADGEVRSQTCPAGSYSQDAIAQGQPALMRLVHAEIADADDAPESDTVLQVVLVLIVALTRAVGE